VYQFAGCLKRDDLGRIQQVQIRAAPPHDFLGNLHRL